VPTGANKQASIEATGAAAPELPEAATQSSAGALDHADDLLGAARLLLDPHPHLAYHLGVLALEEVGRSTLIVVRHLTRGRSASSVRLDRDTDDHVRKLFWALWGPSFGKEQITAKQIESFSDLAQQIHETRKASLYYGGVETTPPREVISDEEARNLVGVATARVEMARSERWINPDDEQADDVAWFLHATEDPEKRRLMMGSKSMKRLAELGGVPPWIRWLREQFEQAEQKAKSLAQRERTRPRPDEQEEQQPKWRVKSRFESTSHSIRPRPLNWWNERQGHRFTLRPVTGKRDQLIVEVQLPKRVSVDQLWYAALGETQALLAALSIGSRGFFWFSMPERVSRFYEEVIDLEEVDARVLLDRSPALQIDWGHRALTEDVLADVEGCLDGMPSAQERQLHAPLDHYVTGLGYLARTDVIMQFESSAFVAFCNAAKAAAVLYLGADSDDPLIKRLEPFLAQQPDEEIGVRELLMALEERSSMPRAITLDDVGALKPAVDALLLNALSSR
jgi:AbiV family abortive infection protein